jgi:hypothetical protein
MDGYLTTLDPASKAYTLDVFSPNLKSNRDLEKMSFYRDREREKPNL